MERIAGDWDNALALAELEPRRSPTQEEKTERETDEPTRRANKPPNYWTLERCVDAVRVYFNDLEAGRHPSRPRYGVWAVGRPDAPSPSTFERYGGWKAVSKLARHRGPIPAELRAPSAREQAEAAILAYLDEHGRIKNADVQALLGFGEDKARRTLNRLRDCGVIRLGSKAATGRSVFYRSARGKTKPGNPRRAP